MAPVDHHLLSLKQPPLVSSLDCKPRRVHVFGLDGHVGIFPVHPDCKALELLRHGVFVGQSVFHALLDEPVNSKALNVPLCSESELLLHLNLYWQTMHVPSRSVRWSEAHHSFVAQNGVLQNFIPRSSEMNPSCCVGGAINEVKLSSTFLLNFSVDIIILPEFENFRFHILR